MKNVFIINPAAGQGDKVKWLTDEIQHIASETGQSCIVEYTRAVGTGETQAKNLAESLNGEDARFYACGGDGTLNEVANGIIGFGNISLGCVPIGTGNDYVRNFGGKNVFMLGSIIKHYAHCRGIIFIINVIFDSIKVLAAGFNVLQHNVHDAAQIHKISAV